MAESFKERAIAALREQMKWAQDTLTSKDFKDGHIDGVESAIFILRALPEDEPPATVLVEMSVEDADFYAHEGWPASSIHRRTALAAAKALKGAGL